MLLLPSTFAENLYAEEPKGYVDKEVFRSLVLKAWLGTTLLMLAMIISIYGPPFYRKYLQHSGQNQLGEGRSIALIDLSSFGRNVLFFLSHLLPRRSSIMRSVFLGRLNFGLAISLIVISPLILMIILAPSHIKMDPKEELRLCIPGVTLLEKDSPYTKILNEHIQNLIDSGTIDNILYEYKPAIEECIRENRRLGKTFPRFSFSKFTATLGLFVIGLMGFIKLLRYVGEFIYLNWIKIKNRNSFVEKDDPKTVAPIEETATKAAKGGLQEYKQIKVTYPIGSTHSSISI